MFKSVRSVKSVKVVRVGRSSRFGSVNLCRLVPSDVGLGLMKSAAVESSRLKSPKAGHTSPKAGHTHLPMVTVTRNWLKSAAVESCRLKSVAVESCRLKLAGSKRT